MKDNSSKDSEQSGDAAADHMQSTTAPSVQAADPQGERLAQLQAQIRSGTYRIASCEIADKLIEHMVGYPATSHHRSSDLEES